VACYREKFYPLPYLITKDPFRFHLEK
jgi:hypothetical protein